MNKIKLSLKIPAMYFHGKPSEDPVFIFLTKAFGFMQNNNNEEVFAGDDNEIQLSFVDMDVELLGALIQVWAIVKANKNEHHSFDVIDDAISGLQKLDLNTFLKMVIGCVETSNISVHQPITLMTATFNDESEVTHTSLLAFNSVKNEPVELLTDSIVEHLTNIAS